jgi:hypothetical protein
MTDRGATLICMEKGRDCWGEVATYSFDMDLPNVTLCKGHIWALSAGAPPHVRMQYAEEMEGLSDA